MVGADRSVYDQFWNEGVERELVAGKLFAV